MSALRRPLLVLLAALAVALGMVVGVVRFVVPQAAPRVLQKPRPATTALTEQLIFVVVDGLRYDTATNQALMPLFASRMKTHASGEIWAGTVSMTSSAVLTYATGQRGGLDQIINNETGGKVKYNSLIENARDEGLITVGIGDHAWFFMFRDSWSRQRPDPDGVAITVDYNHETFDAAFSAMRDARKPNLMVAHFVTPDHQAHAYGSLSEKYRAHIHDFDEKLDWFLLNLPETATVFVTSDHGATDTGTHGSDTPVQRRSPFFAYGPGIVKKAPTDKPLEQIDLASTFAALLGVPAPAHGRGHVLVDWLDLPDEARATVACADLDRIAVYARTSLPAEQVTAIMGDACKGSPREKISRALAASRALDDAMGTSHLGGRGSAWLVPLLSFLGTLGLSILAVGARSLRGDDTKKALGVALVLSIVALVLTSIVERLPWHFPTIARVILYVLGNAVVLYGVIRHVRVAEWFDRNARLGALILPGLLLLTPSRTTQIESMVLIGVLGLFAASGFLPAARPGAFGGKARVVAMVALIAAIVPIGLKENFGIPRFIVDAPFGGAIVATVLLAIERATRDPDENRVRARALAFVGVLVVAGSLWLRRWAPPSVCLAGWFGLPVLALFAWSFRHRTLAELLMLAGYAFISRDFDITVLVTGVLLASAFGHTLAERLDDEEPRPFVVFAASAFVFSIVYLDRIGLENGIDFMQLDWGAGAFRDRNASVARIGLALIWKHALAVAAVTYAALQPLPTRSRTAIAQGLVATQAMRAGFLAVVLSTCGESFWTALRVIGDLPYPLVAMVVSAAALVVVAVSRPRHGLSPDPV